MAQARSQRLIAFDTTSGALSSGTFTAPPNNVVIVKSLYVFNYGTATGTAELRVAVAGFETGLRIAMLSMSVGAAANWQGWLTLNPGDLMNVVTNQSGMLGVVSGAILNGANQFPSA